MLFNDSITILFNKRTMWGNSAFGLLHRRWKQVKKTALVSSTSWESSFKWSNSTRTMAKQHKRDRLVDRLVSLKRILFKFDLIIFVYSLTKSLILNIHLKALLEKNSYKLPLFYQQADETDLLSGEEESVLNEFIVSCILDPKFPSFVKKVENVLNKALKDWFIFKFLLFIFWWFN